MAFFKSAGCATSQWEVSFFPDDCTPIRHTFVAISLKEIDHEREKEDLSLRVGIKRQRGRIPIAMCNRLPAASCTRSLVESTPRSPRTKALRFRIREPAKVADNRTALLQQSTCLYRKGRHPQHRLPGPGQSLKAIFASSKYFYGLPFEHFERLHGRQPCPVQQTRRPSPP